MGGPAAALPVNSVLVFDSAPPLTVPPCSLIEPCFTQKATLSLLEDRRSWHRLPFSPQGVEMCRPLITMLLDVVMEVCGLDLRVGDLDLTLESGLYFNCSMFRRNILSVGGIGS